MKADCIWPCDVFALIYLPRKKAIVIAAACLGFVHCHICAVDQFFRVLAVTGMDADSDTGEPVSRCLPRCAALPVRKGFSLPLGRHRSGRRSRDRAESKNLPARCSTSAFGRSAVHVDVNASRLISSGACSSFQYQMNCSRVRSGRRVRKALTLIIYSSPPVFDCCRTRPLFMRPGRDISEFKTNQKV